MKFMCYGSYDIVHWIELDNYESKEFLKEFKNLNGGYYALSFEEMYKWRNSLKPNKSIEISNILKIISKNKIKVV